MPVYTAPDYTYNTIPLPSVFLAGGISDCPNWQKEVIKELKNLPCIVLNPRREDFPIDDPKAAEEQITWEFRALHHANVFSMWFCAGPSDQPICMYELGRNLALRQYKHNFMEKIAIGVEPGYKREKDVYIQCELVHPGLAENISWSLEEHINKINYCLLEKACL